MPCADFSSYEIDVEGARGPWRASGAVAVAKCKAMVRLDELERSFGQAGPSASSSIVRQIASCYRNEAAIVDSDGIISIRGFELCDTPRRDRMNKGTEINEEDRVKR
jgi:hypothetical protein